VIVATLGIRKFGLAGMRESRLLIAHLLLYAAAGLAALTAGVEGSRLAVVFFGGIFVADAVMRWVGPRMTTPPN
jgi:hypothetical protein